MPRAVRGPEHVSSIGGERGIPVLGLVIGELAKQPVPEIEKPEIEVAEAIGRKQELVAVRGIGGLSVASAAARDRDPSGRAGERRLPKALADAAAPEDDRPGSHDTERRGPAQAPDRKSTRLNS